MNSKQTEQTQIEFNPFGTPVREVKSFVFEGIHERNMAQFGLELDKETGSTRIVAKDPVDLYEVIQSYKDQCGVEFVQKLVARGLASPEDFAAQPIDYGDSSQLPDNVNDAYQQTLENSKLGVDLGQFKTQQDVENFVIAQVKAQLEAAQAKQAAQDQQQHQNQQGDNK